MSLILKNDMYFLKSSKTREITKLSKLTKIEIEFDEYDTSLNFKLNKPNVTKKRGYKYNYELEIKFNLDECIDFLCFITKNMINKNISINNKSYTLDDHYGIYSKPIVK